ncbi:MAG TPA: hypothetical protein VK335_18370 [Bryobacteraceae bacterium]|nr:hypothetical protein [Bryobacteraceae bacterium]
MNIAFLHGYGRVPLGIILTQALTVFTPEYRPVGGLYYRTLFALFGFNPVPFRVATFVLLGLNLVLAARWCRELTDSRFTAAATTVLFSFHPAMVALYYADGTSYDVLCLFFILLTLGQYVRIRHAHRFLPRHNLLIVMAFYGAALGSKEMAITLPGVLILYECVYHPHVRNWRQRLGPIVLLTLMTVLCMIWKTMVPNAMTSNINQGYAPHWQPAYIAHQYLRYYQLLLHNDYLTATVLGASLLLALVLALAVRNRAMLFGYLFANLTLFPVCVIPGRLGFVWYMPVLGWALYGGSATALFSSRLTFLLMLRVRGERPCPRITTTAQMAVLGSLVVVLYMLQARMAADLSLSFIPEQRALRTLLSAARSASPTLPLGSRILLQSDWAEEDPWIPLFLLRLAYRDPSIWVEHAPNSETDSDHGGVGLYTMNIRWDGSVYRTTTQAQPRETPVLLSAAPRFVHRRQNIKVQFPAKFAGCTVDVAYRMPEDELMRAGVWQSWMTLSATSSGAAGIGRDAERGMVVIDHIRACGGDWIPAQGSFVIIP